MSRSMPRLIILAAMAACWVALLPLSRAAEPTPSLRAFQARYQLIRDAIPIGNTQLSLRLGDKGDYVYRSQTTPNALLALFRQDLLLEESRGQIVAGRPKPNSYLYRRSSAAGERQLRLEFDWLQRRVSMRGTHPHWSTAIPAGTVDKLLQQLVFSQDMARGIENARYTVADGGHLKQYHYRSVGRELTRTPLGAFDSVRIERSKSQQSADYTLWLAPVLDYLPLRIVRQHQGANYRMELVELKHPELPSSNPDFE